MSSPAKPVCFVIAPIGDIGSDIRKRSDQILTYLITPACKVCGYDEPLRSDKIDESGFITNQIIQHLIDDEVVVADLTGENPNVFYELAIRHSFRKPVIQLIQSGQKIPFDVAGLRTVEIDHLDLAVAERAREQIIQHMKAIRKDPSIAESPVSVSVDLKTLRSGSSQERELGQLLEGMAKLRHTVTVMGSAIQTIQVNVSSALHGSNPYAAFNDQNPYRTSGVIGLSTIGEIIRRGPPEVKIGLANLKSEGDDDKS